VRGLAFAAIGALIAALATWTLRPVPAALVTRSTLHLAGPVVDIEPLALSPDGRRLVYSTNGQLYSQRLDQDEPTAVPGTEGGSNPFFSPDGESIAFFTGNQLKTVGFAGQLPRVIANIGEVPGGLVGAWDQKGRIFFGISGSFGLSSVPAVGGEPQMFAELEGYRDVDFPDVLPGGEWVLFTAAAEGASWSEADVVVRNVVTGERKVVLQGAYFARYLPTGHLVFVRDATLLAIRFDPKTLETTGPVVPVVQSVDSTETGGTSRYAVAANGTLVYMPGDDTGTEGSTLAVTDRQGNARSFPLPPGDYADPRVSPDGHFLAYTQTFADGPDISIYALDGSAAPRRLTFGGTSRFPAWSSDSTRVFFQSTREGTPSLYWQTADGSGGEPARLTTAADGETHMPDDLSPDGQWLTYTVFTVPGSSSIWTLELATGNSAATITDPGARQAVFSPDGKWIAYYEIPNGAAEVFVRPFPLSGARFQLPNALDNHHPVWSADGRELLYIRGPEGFSAVPVQTEPTFAFGTVATLPNYAGLNYAPDARRAFDVMPDGSGLIGFVPAGAAQTRDEVRIVQNWFEELKQLVPAQ
jgi:Tol biopolymer transport system component